MELDFKSQIRYGLKLGECQLDPPLHAYVFCWLMRRVIVPLLHRHIHGDAHFE